MTFAAFTARCKREHAAAAPDIRKFLARPRLVPVIDRPYQPPALPVPARPRRKPAAFAALAAAVVVLAGVTAFTRLRPSPAPSSPAAGLGQLVHLPDADNVSVIDVYTGQPATKPETVSDPLAIRRFLACLRELAVHGIGGPDGLDGGFCQFVLRNESGAPQAAVDVYASGVLVIDGAAYQCAGPDRPLETLLVALGATGSVPVETGPQYTMASQRDDSGPQASDWAGGYRVNERGETYGNAGDADFYGYEPALIAAVAGNGREGYVRASDLYGPEPKSPEEALRMQEEGRPPIPVYWCDGVTVVGYFG